MADPTLADVLDDEDEDLVQFALTARRYLKANRTALERFEWERAVRRFIGENHSQMNPAPIHVRAGDRAPRIRAYGELDVIEVGANWTPEVGR